MSKHASARYQRKLSGIERYSMVINEIYRYNVDGVIEGSGTIDEDALRRAVAVAAEANPGVRVRLKLFLGFSKWVDSGIAPEVRVIAGSKWDGSSERDADFLQQRFDPLGGGPIADVILVHANNKTGAEKTRVVFRGLHAAMDGRSVMHWIEEVFRALRGEPLLGGASTLTDFDVAERYRDKFDLDTDKKKSAKNSAESVIEYMPVVPPSHQCDPELHYIWRVISIPKRINNILPRAAIFLGQYARRQVDTTGQQREGVVGFTVPVDYRGLRVEANSNGNLTGYLRIHVSSTETPKSVMQQINRQIRDYVDCKMPLMVRPLRWIPVKYMAKKLREKLDSLLYTVNKDLPSGGLVSMGQTDKKNYSTDGFTAERVFGIPGAVGKLNVVAINLPDSTLVTFSAPQNYNRDNQIDNLVEDFVRAFSA